MSDWVTSKVKLAFLKWLPDTAAFPFAKWAGIGRELGVEFNYIRYQSSDLSGTEVQRRSFNDKALQLLEKADAFVVPYGVNYAEDFIARVHTRVAEGARLLYLFRLSTEEWFRRSETFLARYDIAPTKKLIGQRVVGDGSDHFLIKLKRDAGCLLDPRLFQNVNDVVIEHPSLLWHTGNAFPICTATEEHWVVDYNEDLPDLSDLRRWSKNALELPEELLQGLPEGWNVRELACMVVRYNDEGGGVLAMTGGLFSDSLLQANERLARNVIADFVRGTKGPETSAVAPEQLCKQIEINLADFVLGVINADSDWWNERIPEGIRVKCATRQEEERNQIKKKEAYLDLIDLKSIMEKQWKLFEAIFRAAGLEGGKEKCLGWMDRINELRRWTAHHLKRHIAGHNFSPDDCKFLAERHELVLTLKKLSLNGV